MRIAAGIDVGSTYTKSIVLDEERRVIGRDMRPTGFRLAEAAADTLAAALESAGIARDRLDYTIATGFGRHQVAEKDLAVTDITAASRGARHLFPGTRTLLDIGGQTMKATRLDAGGRVKAFRVNDKCAAGTGAFLEKTARHMGYTTAEIGALVATSKEPVRISGVCAVFAESEVINHLSQGAPPAEILQGAIVSLVDRAVQLLKRVQMEPEYTLVGGILRYPTLERVLTERLGSPVNVPESEMAQFATALGAAILGQVRLERLSPVSARA